MSRLVETEAFVTVVKEGSFTAAGDKLGISSSYASKLVSRLEDELGVRLLHRTTRKLALTEAGQRFYEECAEAFGAIEQATVDVESLSGAPRGRLRISLPTNLGLVWLSRAISNFVHAHQELTVDIVYLDRQVDLIGEGFDLAIRIGDLPDSSLIARKLLESNKILVASPEYLEAHGTPTEPEQLKAHDCLVYSYNRAPTSWTLSRGDETREVSVTGRLIANNGLALVEACACGVGVAFLPEFHSTRALSEGRLLRVLPQWSQRVPLHVVYPSARFVPSKVRVLVDYLVEQLREAPWPAV